MKRISAKALRVTGILIMLCSAPVLVGISFAFPDFDGDIAVPILFSLLSLGFSIIVLSVAKRRLERSKNSKKSPFLALTPAQICLIITGAVFSSGLAVVMIDRYAGGLIFIMSFVSFAASVALAVIRAVHSSRAIIKKNKVKNELRKAELQKELAYALRAVYENKLEYEHLCNTECIVCGRKLPNDRCRMVDDDYYCDECFYKIFYKSS